jgi:hypothetical protein
LYIFCSPLAQIGALHPHMVAADAAEVFTERYVALDTEI